MSAGRPRGAGSPAQLASLVLGTWWTTNGVGAFLIDPNFATTHVHGGGKLLGAAPITVNGWHALFHLLPGLLGIALASRPRAAVAYTLCVGAMYVLGGFAGLLAGGNSLTVIAVNAPGDAVHIAEGMLALGAGLLTVAIQTRARPARLKTADEIRASHRVHEHAA